MRMAICTLPPGGSIAVQVRERSARVFKGGDRVDLDAELVSASGDRSAFTWADALGHHVDDHFELAAPAAEPVHEEE